MTHRPDAEAPNEIVEAARAAKRGKEAAERSNGDRKRWPLARIGLAAGIGSAAIAGAVLFANRDKRS